jgi:hypothetical protein
VTLRDAAGNSLSGRTIAWSSSNTAAIMVSPSGQVSAVVRRGRSRYRDE